MFDAGRSFTKSDDPKLAVAWAYSEIEKSASRRYKITKSPIEVWRFLRTAAFLTIRAREIYKIAVVDDFLFPLPRWVSVYLMGCAIDISALANGRDPRTLPATSTATEQMFDGAMRGPLSPAAALAALPAILQFSRRGYNAFKQHKDQDFEELLTYWAEIGFADDPPTKSARISKIAGLMGHEDDRALRRRIARQKALSGDFWGLVARTKGVKRRGEV